MDKSQSLKQIRQERDNTLKGLAQHINYLAVQEHDARAEFIKALCEAKARVESETNMKFMRWAKQYLRKPDGTPWATWTLYNYISLGKKPGRLDKLRASVAKSGREARSLARLKKIRTSNIADEVNWLMMAWERASPEARKQFLKLIKK